MKNLYLTIYRLSALAAGIGWIVCILANFVSGTTVFQFLNFVSGETLPYHPMLDYWMKLAALAFGFIGVGFLYCSYQWKAGLKYGRFFAIFQLLSGVSVLISMARLDLGSKMYILDCLFFFGTGIPMFLAWSRVNENAE